MTDIASLGIEIDSSGANQATTELDRMVQAGARAEASVKSLGTASEQTQTKLKGTAKATKDGNDALRAQQQELSKLLGQIDPVTAALGRLDAQEQKLRAFKGKGLLDTDTFKEYQGRIDASRNSLSVFDHSLTRTGNTAKQSAQALRQLPAQFSDIFVSLQAGQSPLTVFLQQGAQIKDSFGGAGNALKETAKYAAGLINPYTAAAAAALALAVAWKQGSDESVAYNKALILTGNAAGTSADQLANMARAMDATVGTQRQAAEALALVAGSGKFAAENIQLVADAAVRMEEATGQSIGKTVDEFKSLAEEPVSASQKLNEQYNYLTASVYAQIVALDEQGRTQESATLALKSYSDAVAQRTNSIVENLGSLETGWRAVKNVAAEAWDAMLNVGREKTLDQQIDELQKKLDQVQSTGGRGRGGRAQFQLGVGGGGNSEEIRQQITSLELQKQQNEVEARYQAENAKANKAAIDAQKELDAGLKASRTNAQKLGDEYKRIDTLAALSAARGREYSKEQIAQLKADAAERFKDPATPKSRTAAFQDDAATKLLQTLREQEATLNAQLNVGVKLSGANKELVEFNQQITDLKSKGILTAEQKSLLNNEDAIRKQLTLNAAIEDEIKARTQFVDNEKLRIQILKQTGQTKAANDAQLDLEYSQKRLEYEQAGNTEALKRLDTIKQINAIQQKYEQKPGTVEGVSQAPKIAGLDAAVGGPNSEIKRLEKESADLEDWRANELAKQLEFLDAKAINEETYQERVSNINEQAQEKRSEIEQVKNDAILTGAQDFFGNMATLSQSENKKLGAIGKAAAIAQATISGFTAIQNALAVPPYPLGLALAVSAGVMTAANVAQIAGVGFRSGGYTGSGSDNEFAGPVHKNEFVFDAASTARIGVGNLEAARSGRSNSAALTGGGNNVINMPSNKSSTVNQNIYVQGNIDRRTRAQMSNDASREQRKASRLA